MLIDQILSKSPVGIAVIDFDGNYIEVNPAYCQMYGYDVTELLGNSFTLVLPEKMRESALSSHKEFLLHGGEFSGAWEVVRNDGERLTIMVESVRLVTDVPDPYRLAYVVNITEHKHAVQALRDSAEGFRLFAENVPAMAVSYDKNLRCVFANKRFAEFFGLDRNEIVGKHLSEIVGEDAYDKIRETYSGALPVQSTAYQRTHTLANGELRHLEVKVVPHIGDQGNFLGCYAVTTDITESKTTEARIQHIAHHDSITGLPNRLLFNDRLHQAIRAAKRSSHQLALLYLDLDRFKPVNDTLGHAAGDELLQMVAARMRDAVREADTVARVGGDEFTVIMPDITSREDAQTLAGKIRAALVAPFQLGRQGHCVEIGTSIGIAVYPVDGQDADVLINIADAAMYESKRSKLP